jgi:hypothetical protein
VSRPRCAGQLTHITVLLCVSLSASAATAPNPGDMARCAEIAAPDARLACYDKLAGSAERAAPPAAATPAPAAAATPAPTAPATRAPAAIATPAPAAIATPTPAAAALPAAPAPTPASDPRNFGLNQTQLQPVPQGPAAIQAHIAKIINTRYGRDFVVLDNGQTWTYTDSEEDARLVPGDQVTIKRASLGSFLMRTPSKNAYHVRRTQ